MKKTRAVLIAPVLAATGVFAQVVPAPPPPPEMVTGQMGGVIMPGGPGMIGMVSHEFTMVGKAVTGAPYSAAETTESIQTLSDGNRIVNSTTAHIYRDSQGRIRHEVTLPALGGNTNPPTLITISDPVTGVSYSLDSHDKIAWKMPASPKFVDEQFAKFKMSASPAVPAASNMFFVSSSGDTKPSQSHEDLGVQQIDGVNAHGTRETISIAAGAVGNERPITITSERWYSPDLKIELKTVRNDPRMGQTSLTVTDLDRNEPDASLFQVPSDYTIQEGKGFPKTVIEYHKAQ